MSECLRRELLPFGIDVVIVGALRCMTDGPNRWVQQTFLHCALRGCMGDVSKCIIH